MGLTETGINRTLFTLDILKRDVLYILPKKNPDASDFSSARFEPALALSPYLSEMFNGINNVGLKQAGSNNLYVRGAQSTSGLKSVPAPVLVWDELDEMSKAAIALGKERASGKSADQRQDIKISTPTIPEFGIAETFEYSSQSHYFFRCPSCSKFIKLELENLVVTADNLRDKRLLDSYLKCLLCGNKIPHEAKPDFLDYRKCEWVPSQTDYRIKGYRIPQFYSCFLEPWKIAESVLKAQFDPFEEKELHRSKLGLEYVPEGARVLPEEIEACLQNYRNGERNAESNAITLGIDQGKWLHCTIDEWFLPDGTGPDINARAFCRTLKSFKVPTFEELDAFMRTWNIKMCVIDANPERRKAYEFAMRFKGRVFLCFYNRGLQGKQINVNTALSTVAVDRTSWIDVALERFHSKRIALPSNTEVEYKTHIQSLIKENFEDENGNPMAKYIAVDDDHYAHSRTYSEIAVPLLFTLSTGHTNIKDVL